MTTQDQLLRQKNDAVQDVINMQGRIDQEPEKLFAAATEAALLELRVATRLSPNDPHQQIKNVLSAYSNLSIAIYSAVKMRINGADIPQLPREQALIDAIQKIHEIAHDASTGPVVPDKYWDIRGICQEHL